MKKLLLVMLVPVLVLGLVGCGNKLETGSETPYVLHGVWENGSNQKIVIAANEITIIGAGLIPDAQRLAFRSESTVRTKDVVAGPVAFNLKRITDGANWGTITFTYDGSVTLQLDPNGWTPGDVKYYEYINLISGPFTRLGTFS